MTSAQFQLGPYTVRLRQEPGIQCALYHVYRGNVQLGRSASIPGRSDCESLERLKREQTSFACNAPPEWKRFKPDHPRYIARQKRIGAPRKPETIRDIATALAGD